MNIKDPRVHAMARELATRRSSSVTEAVRHALAAELQRTPESGTIVSRQERRQALDDLLERCRSLKAAISQDSLEIEVELDDEADLPW